MLTWPLDLSGTIVTNPIKISHSIKLRIFILFHSYHSKHTVIEDIFTLTISKSYKSSLMLQTL